ncbi:MAG: CotH kinase family protein, partial [Verrucomicrobiales bacterium]
PGQELESFTASFLLQIGGTGSFADGLSLTFGAIPAGNGGGESGFAVDDGLIIAWDTYDNGGDTPSVEVFSDGVSIGNFPHNYGSTAGDWVPVTLHWDSLGLDFSYDGDVLATNLTTPGFVPSAGDRFAFSGRTGGANQNSYLDDLSFATGTQTPITTGGPVITEFVADNEGSLDDEDLDSPDWLELYNGQDASLDIGGHYLTNDAGNKTMWQLPAMTIGAYEYITVFASGKARDVAGAPLHTNFTLPKDGGYLALVAPDGVTVLSEFNYAAQSGDVAYGELGQSRTLGYLETPTPGEKNFGLQAAGPPAEDVEFDRTGGAFSGSTTLAILPTTSPTAVVRFTTNGTLPSEGSAVYTSALSITNTTTVRARVFEAGRLPGEIKSRTLIELASDVQNFSSNLPIVIADSAGVNIDQASNPSAPRPFRHVYTVVIDRDAVDGLAHIDGAPDFTGRGGMHVRGQSSSGFPKKQYAWETWNNEDEDKDVSILGMPSESDWILHAPYSDKTLMRNVVVYDCARQLHGDAGGVRTRFVELFFNMNGGTVSMSDYRGVYVVMEKIKRNKNRVDIEKLNASVTDPELITGGYIFKKDKPPHSQPWNTSIEGVPLDTHDPAELNPEQFDYLRGYVNDFESALHGPGFDDPDSGYASFIDVQSFIDMHLFVETFKEIDGYRISTYFSKDRGKKIRALPVWDYNLALGNADYLQGENPTGWYYTQTSGTNYYWYDRLFQDVEFDLAYWDRFWQLRRGMFSTQNMMARIDGYDGELDGDDGAPNAVTRNFDRWGILGSYVWPNAAGFGSRQTHQAEIDWMKDWLTERLDWIETQSRGSSGLARPPSFNQYGGEVSGGFELQMSDPNGWGGADIYYTIDGSDPRVPGNSSGLVSTFIGEGAACQALVPSVENGGSVLAVGDWTGLADPPNAANWTGGQQGVGYERSSNNRYDPYINLDVETAMYTNNRSCYIRFPFSVDSQAQIDALSQLVLQVRYDDGFVAYLNGVEIARANAPALTPYDAGATIGHGDDNAVVYEDFQVTQFINSLNIGENMLAIHGLNDGLGSSDALWAAQLIGTSGAGNAPAPGAQIFDAGIELSSSAEIRARVYDGSRWSPLSAGVFVVDAIPASADNLVISELHYRPAQASPSEQTAGFLSRGDFEYIELMNIDPSRAVTLEGVEFTDGISFSGFDDTLPAAALVLAPGERVLLVDTLAAFNLRHAGASAVVAGEFTGSLSNDGEQVVLLDAGGTVIRDFIYNDVEPWPVAADGEGFSLVLVDPMSSPDHSDPLSWRSSVAIHGSPGQSDSVAFAGDPGEDADGDGLNAFYEYATGSSDGDGTSFSLPAITVAATDVGGVIADYLIYEFEINLAAEGVDYELQSGDDLLAWSDATAGFVLVSTTNHGDGTATVRYRSEATFPTASPRTFYRLKVSG